MKTIIIYCKGWRTHHQALSNYGDKANKRTVADAFAWFDCD